MEGETGGENEIPARVGVVEHYIASIEAGEYERAVSVAEVMDPHGCGLCENVIASLYAQAVSLDAFSDAVLCERDRAAIETANWYRDILLEADSYL